MAVTFTPTLRHVYSIGDRKEAIYDVACTGTPSAAGDALTAAALKFDNIDTVDVVGGASVVGGTSGCVVAVIHPATRFVTSVTIQFYVQGTAGAANAMVAYSGATAGFIFRARVVGKGPVVGVTD